MNLTLERQGRIAVLRFDLEDQAVNTLNSRLFSDFENHLQTVACDSDIDGAVIISGKSDSFIVGADIHELAAAQTDQELQALSTLAHGLLQRIADSSKPIVAAIHGACMGGGLELALACHYRVASDHARTLLSLPEVMLGLNPGAGGTQRLPRLVGVQSALDMLLTGKKVHARKAYKMGLLDQLAPAGDALERIAVAAAVRLAGGQLKPQRKDASLLEKGLEQTTAGRLALFFQARRMVKEKTGGHYPAPLAIIDCVEQGLSKGMTAGLAKEAECFGKLGMTSVSRSLVSLFFAQNELRKNRYGSPDNPLTQLGVLGAGLMGAGIGTVSLDKAFQVTLKDINFDALARGEQHIWKHFDRRVRRKALTETERNRFLSRLNTTVHYDRLSHCDMVIEAVFEDLELKRRVLKDVEAVVGDNCVFATNTSALPIHQIAEGCERPEKVVGMHYFSPVEKMPLLEVIVTEQTDEATAQAAVDVGIRQGKTVIVVGDGPGFYTTRILAAMMDEVGVLASEGVDFYTLDNIVKQVGFFVGPLTLMDEVGLDVAAHIGRFMRQTLGERVASADPSTLESLVTQGFLGRKSGKGFFIYDQQFSYNPLRLTAGAMQRAFSLVRGQTHKRVLNPEAMKIMQKAGRKSRRLRAETIQQRALLRMVNEAAWCLHEGILRQPVDGDIGAVLGLGFPPFLGGPFRYIDDQGALAIVSQLDQLQARYGERFSVAPILRQYADDNQRFYN